MPNSIDIQVVPKKVATRPLVSGMVDSHSSPSRPHSMMTVTGVMRQEQEAEEDDRAPEVDQAQAAALLDEAARLAGDERADDVGDADHRQREGPDPGGQPLVDRERRQMHHDEGDVEAAHEEAGRQQPEARMPERLAQRLH